MLSNRQILFLSYVSKRKVVPRPESLVKAATFGIEEPDVDALTTEGYLELRHDSAGKPYLAVADKGLAELEKNAQNEKAQRAACAASIRSWIALLISLIALLKGWLFLR